MIQEGSHLLDRARGEARLFRVLPGGRTTFWHRERGLAVPSLVSGQWWPMSSWTPNLVMYDAATLLAELLRGSPDGKSYHLGAFYIEFENNSGAVVSPPTYGRGDGKSYYDGLSTDPNRDYIRVPLTAITMDSTDTSDYPGGNRLTVFAQTEGVTGVHGKSFNDTVQSRIFGGAVVATPVFADQTQDLVYARFYWDDSDNQLIKLAGSQIGIQYRSSLL